MGASTEKALTRRILAGDRAAFDAFLDENMERLFRFALARLDGDRDAAMDVVQQTWLKAIQRLGTYRGEAALFTWLCQICRNAAVDYCRANRRTLTNLSVLESDPDLEVYLDVFASAPDPGPAQAAHTERVRDVVLAVLDHLPSRYGDLLEWKYVEGISVREIGERLGVSAKAAESALTRARVAFREAIGALGHRADLANLSVDR